jgi:hypothetical protein
MSSELSSERISPLPTPSSQNPADPSPTTQQPEIEAFEVDASQGEDINYPTGFKLWLTLISVCFTYFLHGLVPPSYPEYG